MEQIISLIIYSISIYVIAWSVHGIYKKHKTN